MPPSKSASRRYKQDEIDFGLELIFNYKVKWDDVAHLMNAVFSPGEIMTFNKVKHIREQYGTKPENK